MTIIRCDGPRCEAEIPEDAPRYTLWSQGIEVLSEFPQTDFCSLDCVAEYAADKAGLVVNRA